MATAKTAKTAAEKVETMTAETQKVMTEQVEKLTRGFEDVSAFSQQTVEVLMKSSEIVAKAAEGINGEFAAWSKKSFDESVAAAKDMAAAKTVSELVEKQAAFAQASFEGFVNQATRLNDMMMSAAKDMSKPMNEQVHAAGSMVRSFSA